MNKKALIKSVSNYVQSGGETKPPAVPILALPDKLEGNYFTVRDQYPIKLTVKEVVHGSHIAFRETGKKLMLNAPMVSMLRKKEDWVGEKLVIYLVKNVRFRDKLYPALRITPPLREGI